jgi:hypothetical protein
VTVPQVDVGNRIQAQVQGRVLGYARIFWLPLVTYVAHGVAADLPLILGCTSGAGNARHIKAVTHLTYRANKEEYDALETLGATGWNWNSMFPAVKKVRFMFELNLSNGTKI